MRHATGCSFACRNASGRRWRRCRGSPRHRRSRRLEPRQPGPAAVDRTRLPIVTRTSPHSRITGTGSFLPPRRLTNLDMVAMLAARGIETSDEWIVERTGIRARHFADDGINASDLALPAARDALESAGREAADVDLIIVATSTPDMVFPSTASILQRKLGVHGCAAFDVQAVCSGFVYALTVADAMVRAGNARCALVVGTEVFSRILDFDDRTTCVLFGDGAGAVVLEASETPGILAADLHADGRHLEILCTPGTVAGGRISGTPLLKMDGPAVFKLAVGVLETAARAVLEKAGRTEADLDWLIPHQANIRIMQGTARKLKLPLEKLVATVDEHGNTSAASVPLALDVAVKSGSVQRGDTVMLEGVGGGFTWGAVLFDY
ncbi:MAG: ketoacyl-ACP synthase III [Rubrivivax sp.]|nr:ketoacyl-ACP synthase III [Rubrivivax sp.]